MLPGTNDSSCELNNYTSRPEKWSLYFIAQQCSEQSES